MLGQTVARILLVITLIVTAHAIKPFSVKNITSHLLYSSRSLSVILPDSARSGFDRANQLALTLSNSLFSDRQTGLRWSNGMSAGSGSMAINPEFPTDITSYETVAPIKKAKASLKRQIIAVNSIDSDSDLIELAGLETVSKPRATDLKIPREFPAAMPLALPVIHLKMECALLKSIQPISIDTFHLMPPKMRIIYEPKKAGCDKRTGKQTKLIAFIEETKERRKSAWIRAERSIYTMLKCEEAAAKATTEEDYTEEESQELSSSAQEFDGPPVTDPRQHTDNCRK
jgi:hypothetical protein